MIGTMRLSPKGVFPTSKGTPSVRFALKRKVTFGLGGREEGAARTGRAKGRNKSDRSCIADEI